MRRFLLGLIALVGFSLPAMAQIGGGVYGPPTKAQIQAALDAGSGTYCALSGGAACVLTGTITAPILRGASSTILTLTTDAQMLFTNSTGTQGFILATNADGSAAIRTRGGADSANINTGGLRVLGGVTPANGMGLSAANTVGYYANSTLSASLSTTLFTLTSGVALKLGNAYVATPAVGTGTVTVQDSAGNVLRLLAASP